MSTSWASATTGPLEGLTFPSDILGFAASCCLWWGWRLGFGALQVCDEGAQKASGRRHEVYEARTGVGEGVQDRFMSQFRVKGSAGGRLPLAPN